MISFFKRKRAGYQNVALSNAVAWTNGKLRWFANYLAYKTEDIQPKKMAVIIILSCLLFSACLAFTVFKTFHYSHAIRISNIRAPVVFQLKQQSLVDDIALRRIKLFHHYLDSLHRDNFFRYDSIMKIRPHLLDSILAVEQLTNQ